MEFTAKLRYLGRLSFALENYPTCMYRRAGRSYYGGIGLNGFIEAIWANLTHSDCYQRNIVVLLFIRCVILHIIDDSITTLHR